MLRTRLITAIILIPIVAGLVYLGDLPFFVLVAALATLAEIEFSLLMAGRGFRPVYLFGISLVWLCLLDSELPGRNLLDPWMAVILLLSLAWQVLRFPESRVHDWTGALASGLYVGLSGAYLLRLRDLPDGLWWAFTAVSVTLVADTAAYAIGSLWGERKLAPLLSSGKTVEGYLGSVVLAAVAGALLGWIWRLWPSVGTSVTWPRGLVLGLLVATLAPFGDLAISMAKREAGVEDSSSLVPGHGGVLDRLDTVLFASVIGYLYATWLLS